ncbi:MAG: DNA recombination protein RmuC [Candidatus Magasanikbacteria bacterium]
MEIITIAILVVGFGLVIWYLKNRQPEGKESFLMLQEQLEKTRETLDDKLGEHRETLQDVDKKLVKIDKTADNVVDLAGEVKSLQDILKNPQQRGALGEYYLETALQNVLPPDSYEMQYTFEDGLRADAVIFARNKIIPIDSKFSLDNYNKLQEEQDEEKRKKLEKKLRSDLKERIKETSKYIKPQKNTTDFAFMFIPSEALYYDLLVNEVGTVETRNLIEYATGEKNVVVVSPTSFYAYLQTVLQGLKGLKIEESAKEIRKKVRDLSRHLESYEQNLEKMGKHLSTVIRSYNQAYKEFSKIDKDVYKISEESMDINPSELDLPANEEE